MVSAINNDGRDEVDRLEVVLSNLEELRRSLRGRLELVNGQIASTNLLIASFRGEVNVQSAGNPVAASAPVRMAILQILDERSDGADTKAIRDALFLRFGDNLHPKTHYGVLKRLADEGLANRSGSIWMIDPAGKALLTEHKLAH